MGYLVLLERLWQRGLHLVTSIRRNMKNDLIGTNHQSERSCPAHPQGRIRAYGPGGLCSGSD